MGILGWILLGLVAGLLAKALMPGRDPGGIIVTTLLGILGALLGGFLGNALFGADAIDEFWDVSTWLAAIVGSVILLIIYRMATGRRTHH
ncbi:GlsB/YeaQ/YmgE family stress response membrane protein [Allostreptomyces psammosilenae]|uniref:Putative membrane protein YeaQ/YmgE (Transglycosylase-associated protein family) n=1 Tax=Allostreptomyces psammosilenae TaxID=1892865 RepID=A0A852ZUN8_9ACTN|nr:GlsB/YeaQ/YmgE family stress response membrane protein [Allostreptomyces psammosilenae]NYI05635.1 putative membrane protein YeaQ/YmgE (transglycosylase-associated protein family) [Allostreptomyces psammosilenae]